MLLDNMPRIYLKDLYPFTVNTSNQVSLQNGSNVHFNKEFACLSFCPGEPFSPNSEQTKHLTITILRHWHQCYLFQIAPWSLPPQSSFSFLLCITFRLYSFYQVPLLHARPRPQPAPPPSPDLSASASWPPGVSIVKCFSHTQERTACHPSSTEPP